MHLQCVFVIICVVIVFKVNSMAGSLTLVLYVHCFLEEFGWQCLLSDANGMLINNTDGLLANKYTFVSSLKQHMYLHR